MARSRSLWPREHGAYAQLAAPIVAALIIQTPSLPALLLAVAAFAAFLANEPLLVTLGHRGPRLRSDLGAQARGRLVLLVSLAAACAGIGLVLAGLETAAVAALTALPLGALLVLAWRKGQHSLSGEVVAAIALPAACAPIAVASGVAPRTAALLWAAWALGYAASVVAVHRVLARNKKPATRADWIVGGALTVALAILLVLWRSEPLLAIALPLVAIAIALVARPPRARHMRAIGVALVVASVASVGLSVAVA